MPVKLTLNDYKRMMRNKDNVMDRVVKVDQGDTVIFKNDTYEDVEINVVSNLKDFKDVAKKNNNKIDGIILHGHGITLDGQSESGSKGAVFTKKAKVKLFSPDITIQGFIFKGGALIDASIKKNNDGKFIESLLPKRAMILNNKFRDFEGPTKIRASIIGSATFGHPRQLPHASIGIKIR